MQAVISQMRSEGAGVLVPRVAEPRVFITPPQMAPGYAPEQDEILKEDIRHAKKLVNQARQVLGSAGFCASTRVVERGRRSLKVAL